MLALLAWLERPGIRTLRETGRSRLMNRRLKRSDMPTRPYRQRRGEKAAVDGAARLRGWSIRLGNLWAVLRLLLAVLWLALVLALFCRKQQLWALGLAWRRFRKRLAITMSR
jgi:hypothetical protein